MKIYKKKLLGVGFIYKMASVIALSGQEIKHRFKNKEEEELKERNIKNV